VRHEYGLTEKGADLFGVMAAINTWGQRWLSSDDGPPVILRHESCGHDLRAESCVAIAENPCMPAT